MVPNAFSIIGESWNFYHKQPVLNAVLFWLIIMPISALLILMQWAKNQPFFASALENGIQWGVTDIRPLAAFFFVQLLLSLAVLWGIASILIVGRRLVTSKAGRARSSFRIVRGEALPFVLPLFLTGILRDCFMALWLLLLIIPGIIYAIRTIFFHVVLITEGLAYREGLDRSKEIVYGKTFETFITIVLLSIIFFLPPAIITSALDSIVQHSGQYYIFGMLVIDSILISFSILLFTIATIVLYSELIKLPRVTEVKP